jgi:resuscitation-promoting factor RpfB
MRPSRTAPRILLGLLTGILFLTACGSPQITQGNITVSITADGATQQVKVAAGSTVGQALTNAGLTPGNLDRVDPPTYTVLSDGAAIKLVRVREEFETKQEVIPYEHQEMQNESLTAGETRLLQEGKNGLKEITIRHVYEDGVEVSNSKISETILEPETPEIIMRGVQASFPPVSIPGKIAYLVTGGNAWLMEGSTVSRRPLVTTGDLDGQIFTLSPDGNWLLFTRKSSKPADEQINTLWVVDTTSADPEPVSLNISNVVHFADWVPDKPTTIVWSTVEPRAAAPGWQANNDIYQARFVPTGGTTKPVKILDANAGGIYGWWGTSFFWAPDGSRLVYARPDGIGFVDLEAGSLRPLLDITPLNTHGDWAWVPGFAWGADSQTVYLVTHGPATGLVSAEESTDFDLSAVSLANSTNVNIAAQVGMFASPSASHLHQNGNEYSYSVAYMEAIFPDQSATSRYRLVVMDRDGSNRRELFPEVGQVGLEVQMPLWSPAPGPGGDDFIAVIYKGNLWLIDAVTGAAQQVTGDGLILRMDWK